MNAQDVIVAGMAKLTETDVRAIRAAAATGITYRELSARYGVNRYTIGHVVRREKWKHIA